MWGATSWLRESPQTYDPMTAMSRDDGDVGDLFLPIPLRFRCDPGDTLAFPFFFAYNRPL